MNDAPDLFRSIVEGAPVPIIGISDTGSIVIFNGAAERMLGYRADELLGHDVRKLVPEPELETFQGYLEDHLRAEESRMTLGPREVEALCKDGSTVPVSVAVSEARIEGRRVFSAMLHDLSRRRLQERALLESEQLLMGILDSVTTQVAVLEGSGNLMMVNHAWRKVAAQHGFRDEHYGVGSSYLAVCDAGARAGAVGAAEMAASIRAVLGGASHLGRSEYPCDDPGPPLVERSFEARVSAFLGPGRAKAIVTHQEITERKAAEAEQLALTRELDHRVKNAFTTAIALAADTAERTSSVEDFLEAFTGRLEAVGRGHDALAQQGWFACDLGVVAQGVLADLEVAPESGLLLTGDPVVLPAWASIPIAQVLHELASHSIRAGALSCAGGQVRLGWTRTDEHSLSLEWEERDGPEVAPRDLEGGDWDLARDLVGHQLRGSFEMVATPRGVRATVKVALDTTEGSSGPSFQRIQAPATVTADAGVGGLRILVVEDDLLQARRMVRLLGRLGCRAVGPASSPAEALSLVQQGDLAGALLDIDLGETTSETIAMELQERDIPFVFLSGYADLELIPRFESIPRLSKPAEQAGLERAIRSLFVRV